MILVRARVQSLIRAAPVRKRSGFGRVNRSLPVAARKDRSLTVAARFAAVLLGTWTFVFVWASGCNEPVSVARRRATENWSRMHADVTYQLAQDAFRSGAFDVARSKLDQILEIDPQHHAARLLSARVLIEMGEVDRARRVLSEKPLPYLSAGVHAQAGGRGSESQNVDHETSYLLGVVEELSNEYDAAAQHYVAAADARPGHLPYMAAAVEAMLACGDVERARAYLADAQPPSGLSPRWFCLLAEVARAGGDSPSAARYYRRALELASEDASAEVDWVRRELASVCLELGRYDEAIALLNSVLATPEGRDADALRVQLSRCYLAAGDTRRAADVLEPIHPLTDEARSAWLEVARRRMEAEAWPDAKPAIDRVLESSPGHADALMLLTLLQWHSGDRASAGATLARWQAAHPDDPMVAILRSSVRPASQ